MKQNTIGKSVSIEGKGLHTGTFVRVKLHPADPGTGIKFNVISKEGKNHVIPADVSKVSTTSRSTSLKSGETVLHTVEHLLAALYASGVHNAVIDVEGEELPILDGSSSHWIEKIREAGIQESDTDLEVIPVKEVLHYTDPDNGATYTVVPSDSPEIHVSIDFNSNVVAPQYASLKQLSDFEANIAHCRTFVFLRDVLKLADAGLIKGGNLNNAILIADEIPENSTMEKLKAAFPDEEIDLSSPGIFAKGGLSFTNEMARHKLLDLIGDLALTGYHFTGKIFAHKPSHKSNTEFAALVKNHLREVIRQKNIPSYDPNKEPIYNTVQISEVLPHRYPFLLVDKIIELTDNYVTGIKNVTMNEQFFQGHFPDNPVFPGVLQIEAMAQTGGILAISLMPKENDYDTYFLKIDKVKFKQKVVPGDTIIFKMELLEPIRRGICIMQGTAFVGNKMVCEAVLTAQLVPKDKRS